jgi:hypothetical protein
MKNKQLIFLFFKNKKIKNKKKMGGAVAAIIWLPCGGHQWIWRPPGHHHGGSNTFLIFLIVLLFYKYYFLIFIFYKTLFKTLPN